MLFRNSCDAFVLFPSSVFYSHYHDFRTKNLFKKKYTNKTPHFLSSVHPNYTFHFNMFINFENITIIYQSSSIKKKEKEYDLFIGSFINIIFWLSQPYPVLSRQWILVNKWSHRFIWKFYRHIKEFLNFLLMDFIDEEYK